MGFLIGFGIFIGIIIIYLIVIIFFPILKVQPQPMEKKLLPKSIPSCRQDVAFEVEGTTLRAWFYLPEKTAAPVPCVVLSHGFSGTKDFGLEAYALRFVEAGYGALAVDYRHYGDSDGEPRQLYHAPRQVEDLKAAVAYARSRGEIDPERIVIWGTSASGGYGMIVAAEDKRIAGIISQCAALDHKEDSKIYTDRVGMGFFLKLFVHGQRDKGRSRFRLAPHIIPAYGKEGTMAMLTAPGAFEGIRQLAQESENFKNELCGRSLLMPHGIAPLKAAEKVSCPVLIQTCEKDTLVSPRSHIRVAETLGPLATVKSYPIGHFDIYSGDDFKKAVADQLDFLREHM